MDLSDIGGDDLLGRVEFVDGDVGFVELAVVDLVLDKPVHKTGDSIRRIVLERTRCSLEHITHHEDDLLLGLRLPAGIAELRALRRVSPFPKELVVEIRHASGAVVCQDEICDHDRQVMLPGKLHTVSHVLDDILGTLQRRQARMVLRLVGGDKRLVLHEAERIVHLADIVVESSDFHKGLVCADGAGNRLRKSRHLERMLECPGRFLFKLAQEVVGIFGKFLEARGRHEVENPFHQIDDGIGRNLQESGDEEEDKVLGETKRSKTGQAADHIDRSAHGEGYESERELLDSTREIVEHIESHSA